MSEKITQQLLHEEFKRLNNIDLQYDFTIQPIKKITSKCSKNKTDQRGYPDAYIIRDNILCIFECKKDDLQKAIEDLKIYHEKLIEIDDFEKIYFVAYSGTTKENRQYRIFDIDFLQLKQDLNMSELKTSQVILDIKQIHQQMYEVLDMSYYDDKVLFVSSIFIALKQDSFLEYLKKKHNKKDICQRIFDSLEDKILINQLKIITESKDSEQIYDICLKLKNILENYNSDVLSSFFSQFMQYGMQAMSEQGIVLTPHHIVKLMIHILNLNKKDKFIDICSGTGSFSLEAIEKCKSTMSFEVNQKMYSILQCNLILSGNENFETKLTSCFDVEPEPIYTKSAINPPYGQKDSIWKFVYHQLQFIKEDGLACSIIPISTFTDTRKANVEWKRKILQIADVVKIIKCSQSLFQPNAGVQCCVILLQKSKIYKKEDDFEQGDLAIYQDYTNDGRYIKKKVQYENDQYEQLLQDIMDEKETQEIVIKTNNSWVGQQVYKLPEIDYLQQQYNQRLLDIEYMKKSQENKSLLGKGEFGEVKQYKVGDLFDYVGRGKQKIEDVQDGNYPLLSATRFNNGVIQYTKQYQFEGQYISISRKGSTGYCFVQNGRFSATSEIILLKLKQQYKNKFNLQLLAFMMTDKFINQYSQQNSINQERLMNEIIYYREMIKPPQQIKLNFEQQNLELTGFIRYFKISDIFEIVKSKKFQIEDTEEGKYPLISSTEYNNGICKYISEYTNDGEYVTISKNGSVGKSFVQNGKFSTTTDVIILKLKKEYKNVINNLQWLVIQMTDYFSQKYNYGYKLNQERLMNEVIYYQCTRKIDKESSDE